MLQIDHYQGAYGPTIWLEADSPSDLTQLLEIFRELARGAAQEIELCAATDALTRNLSALRLRVDWVLVISGIFFHPDAIGLLKRAGLSTAIVFTESPNPAPRRARCRDTRRTHLRRGRARGS